MLQHKGQRMRRVHIGQLGQVGQLPGKRSRAPLQAAAALPEAVQAQDAQPSASCGCAHAYAGWGTLGSCYYTSIYHCLV